MNILIGVLILIILYIVSENIFEHARGDRQDRRNRRVSTPTVSTPTVSTPTVSTPTISTPEVVVSRPTCTAVDDVSQYGYGNTGFNKMLSVRENNCTNNTDLIQWDGLNEIGQKWKYDNTTKQIKNPSGKCLGLNGDNAVIKSCANEIGQRWYKLNTPLSANTRKSLLFNDNGKCLYVTRDGNGSNIIQSDCTDEINQFWLFNNL
jgi:hypothetical protein